MASLFFNIHLFYTSPYISCSSSLSLLFSIVAAAAAADEKQEEEEEEERWYRTRQREKQFQPMETRVAHTHHNYILKLSDLSLSLVPLRYIPLLILCVCHVILYIIIFPPTLHLATI